MTDTTMPDWLQWAKRLLYRPQGDIDMRQVATALKDSFEQGVAYGKRLQEQEWWKDQDSQMRIEDKNIEKL